MNKLMELVQLNSKEVVKIEHFFTEHFERKVWRIGFYEEPDIKLENAGSAAIKRLLRLLAGVKKSHKVLCLGAHGINLGYLLLERFGCYVTVFCDEDITGEQSHEAMVEGDDAEKMTIERGTMSLLPYASNSFDAVISLETLAFIEDKEGVLRQIADVLKPKGRMLFTSLFLRCDLPPVLSEARLDCTKYGGIFLPVLPRYLTYSTVRWGINIHTCIIVKCISSS